MTFSHALSTNNYGPAKFVVATSAANGTHTTLASALAAASVGDTVFLRDSVTEDVTIPPGVNINGWPTNGTNTPSITGKISMTGAGVSAISNLSLITNSDFAVSVTGAAASVLNLNDCFINCLNNTGINFSSSSSSSGLNLNECTANIATTGITFFSMSSAGNINFSYTTCGNSGNSTTASTTSAGAVNCSYCGFNLPFSVSGGVLAFQGGNVNTSATNTTCITTSATGQAVFHNSCALTSGTASAISIGAGTQVINYSGLEIFSSNTNAITGAGTFQSGVVYYIGSSSTNNVTTQTQFPMQGIGWIPLSTQVASASASVSFTSVMSTAYNNYAIVIDNLVPSVNGVQLNLVYSTDNGGSYANSGYSCAVDVNRTGIGYHAEFTAGTTNAPLAQGSSYGTSSVAGGVIYLTGTAYLSSTQASISGSLTTNGNVAGNACMYIVMGSLGNAADIDAIQIAPASGTITGRITLFGIRG